MTHRAAATGAPARARLRAGVLALLAIAAIAGPSCAPKPKEIVFWQFWPAGVVRPLLDRFEQEHPGLTVRMEPLAWQSGREKITAAMASGGVPDLCEVGSTWMPRLLASGALADWTAGTADLRAGLRGWELCTVGETVYGLPWLLGTRALFWNKALFARARIDTSRAPETWAELLAAAEAVQALGGGVKGFGVQAGERNILFKKFMPFAWGNGGRILSDDETVVLFDSPENRAALEFYLRLKEAGVMARQEQLDRAFKEGKLGAQVSGAWLLQSIPRDAPGLRYGVALVPRPDTERGTHASFAGGEVLVSFARSKQPAGALALARFLARPDNAQALAAATQGVQPAATGADTAAFYREHPGRAVMVRQFETAYFTPNHPAWEDMEAAIEDELEQALHGRKSAAQAVADAQQRLAELVGKR